MMVIVTLLLSYALAYKIPKLPTKSDVPVGWGNADKQFQWPGPCWSGWRKNYWLQGEEIVEPSGNREYRHEVAFKLCEKNPECLGIHGNLHSTKLLKTITGEKFEWIDNSVGNFRLDRKCYEDHLKQPVVEVPSFKELLEMNTDDFVDTLAHGCCERKYNIGGGGPVSREGCENNCRNKPDCTHYAHTGPENRYCVIYSGCDNIKLDCGNNGLPWRTYKRWTAWETCRENQACKRPGLDGQNWDYNTDPSWTEDDFKWYVPYNGSKISLADCKSRCEADSKCTGIQHYQAHGGCLGWYRNSCQEHSNTYDHTPQGGDPHVVSCHFNRPGTAHRDCVAYPQIKTPNAFTLGSNSELRVWPTWGDLMARIPDGYSVAMKCPPMKKNHVCKVRKLTTFLHPIDRLISEKECLQECTHLARNGMGAEGCCSVIKVGTGGGHHCFWEVGATVMEIHGEFPSDLLKASFCYKEIIPTEQCMDKRKKSNGYAARRRGGEELSMVQNLVQ